MLTPEKIKGTRRPATGPAALPVSRAPALDPRVARTTEPVREAERTLDVSLGQTVEQHPPQRQVQKVQQHETVATPQKEVQEEKIHERTHDHSLGIGF